MVTKIEIELDNADFVAIDLARREFEIFMPKSTKHLTIEDIIKHIMREWSKNKIGIEEYYGNTDAE